MSNASWAGRRTRLHEPHARAAGRCARPATGFVSQPEPRTIGSFARGRQLIGGNFLFAGYLSRRPGRAIWDLPMPDPAFEEELHGFTWLDDLAAVGDAPRAPARRTGPSAWIAALRRAAAGPAGRPT